LERTKIFESKEEIDWVFRLNHMTLAFTVPEIQYCKNSLLCRSSVNV